MEKNEIVSQLSEHIAFLSLNRPDARNAISKQMWLQIPQEVQKLVENGAHIIVFEGVGEAFAAGADLDELKELKTFEDAEANWNAIAAALDAVYSCPIPTIAAIDGACMGGGLLLACACDLRYASSRSILGLPIARLGIVLDDVNLGRLASIIGVSRAKEMVYRAQTITAALALTYGLVNDVFDESTFIRQIGQAVGEILKNSAISITEAKASFARYCSLSTNMDNERAVVTSYLGPDFLDRIVRIRGDKAPEQ